MQTANLFLSRFAQLSRLLGKILDQRLKPTGISYQEMRIAGLLMGEDKTTQKILAEKLAVRASTLSVAISKLEAQGLVKRVVSDEDKRVNYLRLKLGNKASKVDKVLFKLEDEILSGVSARDLKTADKVIGQILTNIASIREN